MDRKTPKRTPTPGKRVVSESHVDTEQESCPAKKRLYENVDRKERDPNVLTITELKKLNFSLQDYSYKCFAKVICLAEAREYKSQDVQYHRRAFVLADQTDFVKGFIRNNDDNIMAVGESYYFSKFKMFRKAKLLIHENSIVFE